MQFDITHDFLQSLPDASFYELRHPVPILVVYHESIVYAYLPGVDMAGYGNSSCEAIQDLAFLLADVCKDAHSLTSRAIGSYNTKRLQLVRQFTRLKSKYVNPRHCEIRRKLAVSL